MLNVKLLNYILVLKYLLRIMTSFQCYNFHVGTMCSSIIFRKEMPQKHSIPCIILFVLQVQVCQLYWKKSCKTWIILLLFLGILTLSVTNPIWVVKTRLCLPDTPSVPSHMRYSGLRDGLYKLYTHEGLKGLYKGFVPGLFGTSHGAIQFMIYEELKRQYTHHHSMSVNAALVRFLAVHMCTIMCDFLSATFSLYYNGCIQ